MKRTLLEILAVLAVIVLLASFHHQITRLRNESGDVARLRDMVREAVARADSDQQQLEERRVALTGMHQRIEQLESRLADASASRDETVKLRQELAATRIAADRFRAEIERDVNRTKELVDAYHEQFERLDRKAAADLTETQSGLRELASRLQPDPGRLDREMLAPTVQLNGEDTVGSGTIVYSAPSPKAPDAAVETYVITSYHVVRNILADTRSARRDGISVTVYAASGKLDERADMVCYDELIDAALLKLRSDRKYEWIARAIPRSSTDSVRVWEQIYTVGCPLGNDPIPTRGEISSVRNELNGSNYWMINAPTYFGNSGGGVFLADSRELVGVFSKIYTHGRGNPVVVPHMGLCTPMNLIYAWLEREHLSFVLDHTIDAAESASSTEFAAKPAGG